MTIEVNKTLSTVEIDETSHVIEIVEPASNLVHVSEQDYTEVVVQEQAGNRVTVTSMPHTVALSEEKYFITIIEGASTVIQGVDELTDIGDVVGTPVIGSIIEYDGSNWVVTMADFEIYSDIHVGDSTITYVGKAVPGSVPENPVWQLQRITIVGDAIHIDWANGANAFDQIYNDRESIIYS